MILSLDDLKKILTRNKEVDAWCRALNELLPKYNITNKERIAAFIAQTAHESANFTALSENLNYSADGLARTWPNRFAVPKTTTPNLLAKSIQRNPEAIANHVYGNRMGNGNVESGDGWKFRGRGLIQLTGKENYTRFSKVIDKTLDQTIVYLETKEGAVESACWFWNNNNLNALADKQDMTTITKRINGGLNGFDDRMKKYNLMLSIL